MLVEGLALRLLVLARLQQLRDRFLARDLDRARIHIERDPLRDLEVLLDARLAELLVEQLDLRRVELGARLLLEFALDEALLSGVDRRLERRILRRTTRAAIAQHSLVPLAQRVADAKPDPFALGAVRAAVAGEDARVDHRLVLRIACGSRVEVASGRVDRACVIGDLGEKLLVLLHDRLVRQAVEREGLAAGNRKLDLRLELRLEVVVDLRALLGVGAHLRVEGIGTEVRPDRDKHHDGAEDDDEHVRLHPEKSGLDLRWKLLRHH